MTATSANIKRALAQPDLTLAIMSGGFVWFRHYAGQTLPAGLLWTLTLGLAVQCAWVHAREFSRIGQPWAERRTIPLIFGVLLWCWCISLTGGVMGPLPYLCMLPLLHNLRSSRTMRAFTIGGLAGLSLSLSLVPMGPVGPYVVGSLPALGAGVAWCLVAAVALVLGHCIIFAEFRPLQEDLFMPMGTFGPGYLGEDSFFRALLARAIRLYEAKGGFVALRAGPKAPGPGDGRDADILRIRYRAGRGAQGWMPSGEAVLDRNHIAYKAMSSGTYKVRRSLRRWRTEGGLAVRSEMAIPLTRFQKQEVVAVISVFSEKRTAFLFPSTYYLQILCAEAETIYEMLAYASAYHRLLLIEDTDTFTENLNRMCNELVPPYARPATVKLEISSERPKPSQAIVPVYHQLQEPRRRPRWLTVSADMKSHDLAAIQTIRHLLQDVASAPVLLQMADTRERLEASQKEPIGLSNLEPPDLADLERRIGEEQRLRKEGAGGCAYEQAYRGLGFRLLWANRLMKGWFPRIVDHPPEESPIGAAKAPGIPDFCYHYYNRQDQEWVCWYCPCLALLKRYVAAARASEAERLRVASSVEIMMSHSPAGQMQIFRHYELAAAIVLNAFPPREISFIRETVTDRTLEVETLAILSGATKALELFVADVEGIARPRQVQRQTAAKEMLLSVAEGLGRSFHAVKVVCVDLGQGQGNARVISEYASRVTREDSKERRKLIGEEWRRLEDMQRRGQGVLEYCRTRPQLFREVHEERPIPADVAGALKECTTTAEESRAACEVRVGVGRDASSLFGWELFSDTARSLVVHVPYTSYAIIVATDAPEAWEKAGQGEELLPRDTEMALCQCVGDILGFLLHALDLAAEFATSRITEYVGELAHGMRYILLSVPLQAGFLRRLMIDGLSIACEALTAAQQHGMSEEMLEWYDLLAREPRPRVGMSARERHDVADKYIAMTFPEGTARVDLGIFDKLADSGIAPDRLSGLEKTRDLPADQKGAMLRLMASVASASRSVHFLRDAGDEAGRIFDGIIGRPDIATLGVSLCVERIVRLLGTQLAECAVTVEVPADLSVRLDRTAFSVVAESLVRNAIEAATDESSEKREVQVRASRGGRGVILQVTNPPPPVPSDIRQRMFERRFSTKKTGIGYGLYSARRAADQVNGTIEYSDKDGWNVFTAEFPLED